MEENKKTAEEQLIEKLKLEIASSIEGKTKVTTDRMEAIEAKLATINNEALKAEIVTLSNVVNALKEKGAPQIRKAMSVKEQLKSFAENNKEKWAAFKKGEMKQIDVELDLKAAATMLESTNLNSSAYLPVPEMVQGITPIARAQALIEQYANTSTTNSAVIVWVNYTNTDGTVVETAEGVAKPLIDFELETETSNARKVPGKIKISTEMLEDFDFMASSIENELRYQVDKAVDTGLLTGDGIAPNLKGITEYAGGYILTTLDATDASKADAIMACAVQLKSLEFQGTHAFVNPIDAGNMSLIKDSQGQYVIPPFQAANGMTIAGLQVVESNKITQGYVLVADMSKYIVRNYKPFSVSFGYVNDDFEKNLVTVIGERRLHAYASDNNTGAFVYDTFANIVAALEPAP